MNHVPSMLDVCLLSSTAWQVREGGGGGMRTVISLSSPIFQARLTD